MPTFLEFLFCKKRESFFQEYGIVDIVLEDCEAAIVSDSGRFYLVILIG